MEAPERVTRVASRRRGRGQRREPVEVTVDVEVSVLDPREDERGAGQVDVGVRPRGLLGDSSSAGSDAISTRGRDGFPLS